MVIMKGLNNNVGVVRRYSKMQFKKLLKDFLQNGMHENFGQNTILKIKDYMNKKLVKYGLSYQDSADMKQDLQFLVHYINETLGSTKDKKDAARCLLDELDGYTFFEEIDFSKYDF